MLQSIIAPKGSYFASDGSFGSTDQLIIVMDTTNWTEQDWQDIEEASDSERASVAHEIAQRHWNDSKKV